MVIPHFDDELGAQRLPLAGALGAPAARSTGGTASEAGRRDKVFEAAGQFGLVARRQGCGEADMVQQAGIVIEAEEQRTCEWALGVVAKPADDAIGRARQLVFLTEL